MTKRDDAAFWVGVVVILALAGGGAVVVYKKTRGLRNNNPGNIRRTNPPTQWQGMAEEQTDAEFVQFSEPKWGIRALARVLKNYRLGTIRAIITRWAPPSENDTESYIAAVSRDVGIGANDPVNLTQNLAAVVKAIIRHENGIQPYSDDTINAGIALA